MLSVRFKFTLVLIITSFAAIATVGALARWLTVAQFNDAVVERAFGRFSGEAIRYFDEHGSWEAGQATESFHAFRARTRPHALGPRPEPPGGRRPPPSSGPPTEQGRRFGPGGPPPPFFLVDRAGTVLLGLAGKEPGDKIAPDVLDRALPIVRGDSLIALAIALERPALTELEERYLDSIETAWIYALLAALALALPVGLVLGSVFSAPIKDLHRAFRAMEGGDLRQLVRVRSNDEIGQLSAAFNQMSGNLAATHDKLEASRARLGEQAEALEELSRRDPLTGLFNRRAFDELVANLFAQARRMQHPLTLGMIDIDHFKKVNDDFSHATGDEVLREVARLISTSLREVDLVARYGGEEFVIAFPATDLDGAKRYADRLRAHVAGQDWQAVAAGGTDLYEALADRETVIARDILFEKIAEQLRHR